MEGSFVSHPLIKQNKVERRLYQEVIAGKALTRNTLVVLPTGLGKTIIAALVAAVRLYRYPNSKVLFIAPTRPLVEQHKSVLREIMRIDPEKINSLTGKVNPSERGVLWEKSDIVCATPQVIQNDVMCKRYDLKKVSLTVFDECHKAVGEHPYVYIAKIYKETSENPLILAMTASPGSDAEKIEEVKKNLFLEGVEVRDESSPDVAPYIKRREIEWIMIELPDEFREIVEILTGELKKALFKLREGGLLEDVDVKNLRRKDLIDVKFNIQKMIGDETSPEIFEHLKTVANAIRLTYMLEIIETQGTSSLLKYMERVEKESNRSGARESLKELVASREFKRVKALLSFLKDKNVEHPKLSKLVNILKEHFKIKPNSRVLIFTNYRVSAKFISEYLSDNGFLSQWFIGQGKRITKGMTQKEQLETLDRFRDGTIRILVATSVAEEGLDIEECDLVIFYDSVPSAIRRIQRMGRTGRSRKGRVVVLITKGTRDEGYYWASFHKERKMRKLLESMSGIYGIRDYKSPNFIRAFFDEGQTSLDQFIDMNEEEEKEETREEVESRFFVVVDSREMKSPVVRDLSLLGVEIEVKPLEVGDYIISEKVAVERKTTKDFLDSIVDGRLFEQAKKLTSSYEKPIMIIEGESLYGYRDMDPNAIRGAILSLLLDFPIKILRTENPKETSRFLYNLIKREQEGGRKHISVRHGKVPSSIDEIQEYVLAGIPNVDRVRASLLLKEFKTLRNIFNSDIKDLMKVPRVGKKIAEEIFKIANTPYKGTDDTSA
ncbi:MAG: DEAD/DEAH box helicase [Candidatus Asgardarchaeia archaeon]